MHVNNDMLLFAKKPENSLLTFKQVSKGKNKWTKSFVINIIYNSVDIIPEIIFLYIISLPYF